MSNKENKTEIKNGNEGTVTMSIDKVTLGVLLKGVSELPIKEAGRLFASLNDLYDNFEKHAKDNNQINE